MFLAFACRFNTFDFAPIFHRDEDTNPDELRVSAIYLLSAMSGTLCISFE